MIGGGRSGREAAAAAAAAGGRRAPRRRARRRSASRRRTRCSRPARAIGIYEGGLVPVDAGDVLYRVRAGRIVVATGALEQPLVFPGNDLVGVMLPGGRPRGSSTTGRSGPATRAVVVGADDARLSG